MAADAHAFSAASELRVPLSLGALLSLRRRRVARDDAPSRDPKIGYPISERHSVVSTSGLEPNRIERSATWGFTQSNRVSPRQIRPNRDLCSLGPGQVRSPSKTNSGLGFQHSTVHFRSGGPAGPAVAFDVQHQLVWTDAAQRNSISVGWLYLSTSRHPACKLCSRTHQWRLDRCGRDGRGTGPYDPPR
jgi:hypothetical protein